MSDRDWPWGEVYDFDDRERGPWEDAAYHFGAASAFGLLGMAYAIQANAPRLVERSYWTSELDGTRYYDCPCPGCGAYMKHRRGGEDEGTLSEWCGVCRY